LYAFFRLHIHQQQKGKFTRWKFTVDRGWSI
jgi:hypothetical protein